MEQENKIRKTSELLEMIYNNLMNKKEKSICMVIVKFDNHGIIERQERINVISYIFKNKPLNASFRKDPYFWKPWRQKPRLRYLKKHIRKCKKFEEKQIPF